MIRKLFHQTPEPVRKFLKACAQRTIGRLPGPKSRLGPPLASNGGRPVRDVRFRPWASVSDGNLLRWHREMRSAFRKIYLGGAEGLPQPLASEFAPQWAEYCGCRYGLLLTNGTDALRLGLAAVLDHDGLDYGGEIIVPNFSYIASATAPIDRRFGVAFVDVDPETLLLDPKKVEEAIIPGRTRAIMPVHLFGQPADMTALNAICAKHNLAVLEDAAQAQGAAWETGPVGSLGKAAAFSFQSSKNLSCGEGGALTTNDEKVFDRAYSLHNAGRPHVGGQRWEHVTFGLNCRITEYQVALLLHRFELFKEMQATRQERFQYLRELMTDVACLKPLAVSSGVRAHGMYMFAMRYSQNACADLPLERFLQFVRAEGAPVYRAFASTMSEQPVIQSLSERHPEYIRRLPTPVADAAAHDTVYIPHNVFVGSRTDMEDIASIFKKVERYFSKSKR